MATTNRLTAAKVAKAKAPGRYADGGGLYFLVGRNGARSYIFRYTLAGRAREMGLGSAAVGLAGARQKVQDARQLLASGIDPIESRTAVREERRLKAAKDVTFDQCVDALIVSRRAGWKNVKHAEQWRSTLAAYASPKIGKLPVSMVDTPRVMEVLQPIWAIKPETARRVRGRIEAVLVAAKVMGYRTGDNPAQWRHHLDQLLPARAKVRRVKHHAALPYQELPHFMGELRQRQGTAIRALTFAILTAGRTSEVIGARWKEIDWSNRLWIIPAGRMKGDREHRIPLSADATAVLKAANAYADHDEFIFPAGNRRARHLSNMAMLQLLSRMGHGNLTVHGFRSTFRDWAAECTGFPRELAEKALAHVVGDETERAYQRGDLLEKRRQLMEAWAEFCTPQTVGQTTATIMLRP